MDSSLGISVYIHYDDESVASFEYERTLTEPQSEEANGLSVSYYHNHEDGELSSASWINGEAHYHVESNITDDGLRQVVASLIK